MIVELAIIVALVVLNGVLAMSEMALVSSRPARLKVLAEGGRRGAAVALRLSENPGRFLSTVQVGITLVGVLSGAFSGATVGARLSNALMEAGYSASVAQALGFGGVVVLITYLSLIIGELVPKQIALRDPERIAAAVAPTMVILSRLASPLVWLLDASGQAVLALLGQRGASDERVTEEEVKTIIAEAESAGVLESEEKAMISGVMRLSDRAARALMTPRSEVEIVDLSDDHALIMKQLRRTRRARLPVHEGNDDAIIGVVAVKDVLDAVLDGREVDLRKMVQAAPVVMDSLDAIDVIGAIRASPLHMALVFDEYGHFEGIITSGDLLEAIAGSFVDQDGDEPAVVRRDDGTYLVAGWMPVDEFADQLGAPVARDADYETVAGFILDEMKHLPGIGESFEKAGWRFEVMDLDGRRIDKILVTKPA
ncbi:MAG: hemolysin family protein [Labrys sp. (in: a-proteobacteria)]